MMEQILLTYCLPKETVVAMMILNRNTKVKLRSPDGDSDNLLQEYCKETHLLHTYLSSV